MEPRPARLLPPTSVIEAWASAPLEPLAGGQGMAFASGKVVLKPVHHQRQHEWLAGVLASLDEPGDLRIIRPVRAPDGGWTVDGWSAWGYMEGAEDRTRWRDALSVSDRFHSAVAHVSRSDAMDSDHAWARSDGFAWGERPIAIQATLEPLVDALVDRRTDVKAARQLVHGDLGGNILFHPELPPAVIDVSPYWRPKDYADAIVVVDAAAWGGAALDALVGVVDRQLLIRALLFRIGVAGLAFDAGRLQAERRVFEPIVRWVLA